MSRGLPWFAILSTLGTALIAALAPAAPTNVTARVIRSTLAPDTDVVVVTWTLPPGTLTYTHVRFIPGDAAVPALGGDAGSVCPVPAPAYHQYAGARAVDTFKVIVPASAPTAIACKPIVRVGDATGSGPWAVGATLCYSRGAATCGAPPVAASVTINQSVVELVGQRTPLVATVRDASGAVIALPVTWVSRTPAIATVDTAGVVLGVAPGVDTVTATSGAVRAQTLVTIQAGAPPPPPPPSGLVPLLVVVPAALNPVAGMEHPFYAILRDSTGAVTAGVRATWTVADTTICTVDVSGVATFRSPGQTMLTATVGSLQASALVNVVSAGAPVRVNFFGKMQTVYPGPQVYILPDSLGRRAAHAYVTVVVP